MAVVLTFANILYYYYYYWWVSSNVSYAECWLPYFFISPVLLSNSSVFQLSHLYQLSQQSTSLPFFVLLLIHNLVLILVIYSTPVVIMCQYCISLCGFNSVIVIFICNLSFIPFTLPFLFVSMRMQLKIPVFYLIQRDWTKIV